MPAKVSLCAERWLLYEIIEFSTTMTQSLYLLALTRHTSMSPSRRA